MSDLNIFWLALLVSAQAVTVMWFAVVVHDQQKRDEWRQVEMDSIRSRINSLDGDKERRRVEEVFKAIKDSHDQSPLRRLAGWWLSIKDKAVRR